MIKLGIIGSPLTIISHLPKEGTIADVSLTGYFNDSQAITVNNGHSLRAFGTPESLVMNSDAVVIAGNRNENYNTAVFALKHARHVFLPVTLLQSVAEAGKLVKLALEANVLLKVYKSAGTYTGFTERFMISENIWLIELHHDAMVVNGQSSKNLFNHLLLNLDFILGLTRSNVVSLKAKGFNMLSNGTDIINARMDFDNGCSATLTCNFASMKDEHYGTLVLKDQIIRVDFQLEEAVVWNITHSKQPDEIITTAKYNLRQQDVMSDQLLSFISSLKDQDRLMANPEDGFKSFILASKIMDRISRTSVHAV
jgi:hypothetical protein